MSANQLESGSELSRCFSGTGVVSRLNIDDVQRTEYDDGAADERGQTRMEHDDSC